MNSEVLTNISKILERDSKTTTYKFALLRGVIDIILESSPYIKVEGKRVRMPVGLMIGKWLTYYYPIAESDIRVPQINGATKLAFEGHLNALVFEYKGRGEFSAFYNDLMRKSIPEHVKPKFLNLVQQMRSTITQRPMRHIGTSINNSEYSIFDFESGKRGRPGNTVDIQYLIRNFGTFSIPVEYYEAFRFLGRFVNGKDSILMKWAEFSHKAASGSLSVERVLRDVLRSPVTDREVKDTKHLYEDLLKTSGRIRCVWTDKPLTQYDVDHVIPFSIWKNNDLWNLLPSSPKVNNQKRDRIPSSNLIEQRQDAIIHYWQMLHAKFPQRFRKEIEVTLLGDSMSSDWPSRSILKLRESCDYLVGNRGYESWNSNQ